MDKERSNHNYNETRPFQDIEWKSLKTSFFCIIIIIFILFTTLLIFSINSRAIPSDITYTFNNNLLYTSNNDNNSISFYKTWNLKNRTINTNNYTATLNFTSDILYSEPNDTNWNIYGAGGFATIQNLKGFNHVLLLNDTIPANRITTEYRFTNGIYDDKGTIEYWLYTNDTTERSFFRLMQFKYGGNYTAIRLRIENGNLEYYTGASWSDTTLDITQNIWNYIRIDFACDTETYLGCFDSEFRVSVNGVNSTEISFITSLGFVDGFLFRSYTANTNDYYQAIDNIGIATYSRSYIIGSNLYPYSYQTTNNRILDTRAFEFALESINNLADIGDDNPYGFTENDDGGDFVNIAVDTSDTFDRLVRVDTNDVSTYGIYKTFNNLDGSEYNITAELNFTNVADDIWIEIFSNDTTSYAKLLFAESGVNIAIEYYDGSTNIELYDGIDYDTDYLINFYLNNNCSIVIVRVKEIGGSLVGVFQIPFYTSGKNGIGRINIYGDSDIVGDLVFEIDSIGIFENGVSVNNDFAFATVSMNTQSWSLKNQFLMTIRATGYNRLYKFFNQVTNESYYDNVGCISSFLNNIVKNHQYSNISQFINIYADYTDIGYPELIFYTTNESFSCLYLNIDGVILNNIPMTFDYANMDINSTYFYVDNHYLKWDYNCSNDGNLEYLQASFDIFPSVSGINRSVRFISRYNGSNYGYFYTNYSDTTVSLFYLFPYPTTQALYITPDKFVDGFSVLITDNNEGFNIINASGYVTGIKLIYNPNYYTTISTVNLLSTIAPLLILIIPTLIVYFRLGKIAILPMLLLMTVVCFIGSFIPNWLFFILLLTFGTLLIFQQRFRKERGDV